MTDIYCWQTHKAKNEILIDLMVYFVSFYFMKFVQGMAA